MNNLSPEQLDRIHERISDVLGLESKEGVRLSPEGQIALWKEDAQRIEAHVRRVALREAQRKRARERYAEHRQDALIQGLKKACAEWRNPKAPLLVYFARCGEFVKIGYTANLQQRLESIMMVNPFVIEIVGCLRGPVQLERAAQAVFENHHHRGEWYHYNPLVRRAIKLQGRFDMQTAFIDARSVSLTGSTS